MANPTKEQVIAVLELVVAIGNTIRELDKGDGVPAGEIYAAVMGKVTMADWQAIIRSLEHAKMITYERSHLIRWIGPRAKAN